MASLASQIRANSVRDAPATRANAARNAAAGGHRADRWRGARDALWRLLERHVRPGARVAMVGAGHGHDVPLTRLLARAGVVDLVDVDAEPARRALRREPRALRRRGRVISQDVTDGAADRVVRAVRDRRQPWGPIAPARPLTDERYDVVVGDLLYSQLLYPGLLDAAVSPARIAAALERFGPPLTGTVVERLHASAPHGIVVHLHDVLGWWPTHEQPFAIGDAVKACARDAERAVAMIERGHQPRGCDPRRALAGRDARVIETAFWRWPFDPRVDYLVCATVALGDAVAAAPAHAVIR